MDILFTAGNFDDNGGRPSGLAAKMIEVIKNMEGNTLTFMNGGTYDELVDAAYVGDKYDVIFWFANVPNDKSKIDVKGYAPRALLVSSKRNNDEYEFHELVMRSLKKRASLTFEFNKNNSKDGKFGIMVFDVLGNQWYKGHDYEAALKAAFARIEFLLGVKRITSYPSSVEAMCYFNWFRKNMGKPSVAELAPVPDNYLELVTGISEQLYENVWGLDTRCNKSFPSFKDEKGWVYVGTREVLGKHLSKEDFVHVSYDGSLAYYGSRKPSVDAPIHMELYKSMKEIRYIIHTHCYIEGPNFEDGYGMTKIPYPCGALQEVEQILNVVKSDYMSEDQALGDITFAAVNEIGHGSIVMSSSIEYIKNFFELHKYVRRPLPEVQDPERR